VKKKNKDLLGKAKNYAFLLLKFRLRSENELRQRLRKKKFDDSVIDQTISFLKEKKFLDDSLFARSWIQSRIRRPFGLKRIKEELKIKGLDREIINKTLQELLQDYSEQDVVQEVAQERLGRLRGIDPRKAKRRLYAYLLRRGFSPEVVMDTINQLCRQIP
jgi:regulatory protein